MERQFPCTCLAAAQAAKAPRQGPRPGAGSSPGSHEMAPGIRQPRPGPRSSLSGNRRERRGEERETRPSPGSSHCRGSALRISDQSFRNVFPNTTTIPLVLRLLPLLFSAPFLCRDIGWDMVLRAAGRRIPPVTAGRAAAPALPWL